MARSAPTSRSLEDYWAIVRRRFWWVTVPLFVCWVVVWGLSWRLPPIYQSDALILVEQQKVPENYVVANVTVSLQDRLQSMTQQILSRTRLQTTIDRFHLYSKPAGFFGFSKWQDPIDEMRKDIKIDLVASPGHQGELTSFKIQYSAGSPELAQQVNSELTSLFIDENLKAQQQLSESTTAFLDSQLADARVKLEEQEAKVRAFKATHFGDLPSQMQSNVQILTGLQTQLDATQRDLDGARQQRLYLESLQKQYDSQRTSQGGEDSVGTSPEALDRELANLRLRLANAVSQYTEDYPDVITLKDKIAKTEKLKKQIEDEIASSQKTSKDTKVVEPGAVNTITGSTPSTMQMQSQLEANQLQIQDYEQRQKKIESQISDYQARLNLTPQTEQELADISRGYDESMSNYNSLLQKQMQSQLATSLEQRQQGEQFRILDPPSLPIKPTSPNHLMISIIGLAVGAALGMGLAALLELTDVRIWQGKDLEGIVPARLLVALPHLSTPREERFGSTVRWVKIGATVAIVVAIVAGNLYSFYKG
jgi:polysaccharide chain length determinant protein (PEP-CTERM system associated)